MAEPALFHVLLIYPVGANDLRLRGEHGAVSNPGKNYREEIARRAQCSAVSFPESGIAAAIPCQAATGRFLLTDDGAGCEPR